MPFSKTYRGTCQHCHKRQASRPRKLCGRCFADPLIRQQYPVRKRYQVRLAYRDVVQESKLTRPKPTHHAPGTKGKIAELGARLERGQQLWSDEDSEEYTEGEVPSSVPDIKGLQHES